MNNDGKKRWWDWKSNGAFYIVGVVILFILLAFLI